MHKKTLFFVPILLLFVAGFLAIQSGAVGLLGIFRSLIAIIAILVLVVVIGLALVFIWAIAAGSRKKTARAVDGPRLVQQLPDGDWASSALAFHERCNLVVSTILADDEAVLKAFPVVPPDPHKVQPTWIRRIDKDSGCLFETDIEGEGDYCLRYSSVRQEVPKENIAFYVTLFKAWASYHVEKGTMKVYNDQEGTMYCWKVGPDDVIGVKIETRGGCLWFSATRAWVGEQVRHQFPELM